MSNITMEQLTSVLETTKGQPIKQWRVRSCSLCAAPLSYVVSNGHIFYDSDCDCVSYYSDPPEVMKAIQPTEKAQFEQDCFLALLREGIQETDILHRLVVPTRNGFSMIVIYNATNPEMVVCYRSVSGEIIMHNHVEL